MVLGGGLRRRRCSAPDRLIGDAPERGKTELFEERTSIRIEDARSMTYDPESQFASSSEVIRQSCGLEIPIVVPGTLGVVTVS